MESKSQATRTANGSRKEWMHNVLDVQQKRNPEELEAVRKRVESARQHEVAARKCKAVKGYSMRNMAIAAQGLAQIANVKKEDGFQELQSRLEVANQVSRTRQQTKCSKLGKMKRRRINHGSNGASGSGASCPPRDDSDEEDAGSDCSAASVLRGASDSEEEALGEAAQLVGASDVAAIEDMANVGLQDDNEVPPSLGARAAGYAVSSASDSDASNDSERVGRNDRAVPRPAAGPGGGQSAVAELLSQLRREPKDQEECAAKFALYTGYASEVENMRNTLFAFHAESRENLPDAIAKDMDKQIRGVDNHEAMGIPDRSRDWFVYHMMSQSQKNNAHMSKILDDFDKKLKFLAKNDQVECPICLDEFGDGDMAAETLGCCHKVCKNCWTNWTRVMHGRAFCPVCRHAAFLGAVSRRVAAPHDSDEEDIDSEIDSE